MTNAFIQLHIIQLQNTQKYIYTKEVNKRAKKWTNEIKMHAIGVFY